MESSGIVRTESTLFVAEEYTNVCDFIAFRHALESHYFRRLNRLDRLLIYY